MGGSGRVDQMGPPAGFGRVQCKMVETKILHMRAHIKPKMLDVSTIFNQGRKG
jgi:hypothetical protein